MNTSPWIAAAIIAERLLSRFFANIFIFISLYSAFVLARNRMQTSDYTKMEVPFGKFVFRNFGPSVLFLTIGAFIYNTNSTTIDVQSLLDRIDGEHIETSQRQLHYFEGKPNEPERMFNVDALILAAGTARKSLHATIYGGYTNDTTKAHIATELEIIDGSVESIISNVYGKKISSAWEECTSLEASDSKCDCDKHDLSEDECNILQRTANLYRRTR